MFFLTKHFFSNLIYFATNSATKERVDIEPMVIVSKFSPYFNVDDEIFSFFDLEGKYQPNRILTIQFSIDYGFRNEQVFDFVSYYFKLESTEIQCLRYKRKLYYNEPFNIMYHSPEIIILPKRDQNMLGFELNISDSTNISDTYILKRGCQLISLNYNVYNQTKLTTSMVINSIYFLRQFFGTHTDIEAEKYAFQFLVKTAIRHPIDDLESIKIVHTYMFKMEFSVNKCSARLMEVNKNDYHIFTP